MNQSATLTKRETEITELLAWGSTYKDVANRLFISTRTVETTARNVKSKVGVTKVNELSAWWFCTHFNIPLTLSPLKRGIISVFFLLVFLPFEFSTHSEVLRNGRARTEESRTREVKSEEDYLTIDF